MAIYGAKDPSTSTVPNQPSAIKRFLRHNSGAILVLEATGGYEAALIEAALAKGHIVYRVNARRVRAFMESKGIYAKTDAIDAKALAAYAQANASELRPFEPPTPEYERPPAKAGGFRLRLKAGLGRLKRANSLTSIIPL